MREHARADCLSFSSLITVELPSAQDGPRDVRQYVIKLTALWSSHCTAHEYPRWEGEQVWISRWLAATACAIALPAVFARARSAS